MCDKIDSEPTVDESKEPVLCPIAALKGCRQCPFFKTCPVKETFGNYRPTPEEREALGGDDSRSGGFLGELADCVSNTIKDVADSGRRDLEEAAEETRKRLEKIKKKS